MSKPPVLWKGAMSKKAGWGFTGYKRRYFELRQNGVIYYYDDKNYKSIKGDIDLKNASRVITSKQSKNKFTIKTPERDWELWCSNKNEADMWVSLIVPLIRQYRQQKLQNKLSNNSSNKSQNNNNNNNINENKSNGESSAYPKIVKKYHYNDNDGNNQMGYPSLPVKSNNNDNSGINGINGNPQQQPFNSYGNNNGSNQNNNVNPQNPFYNGYPNQMNNNNNNNNNNNSNNNNNFNPNHSNPFYGNPHYGNPGFNPNHSNPYYNQNQNQNINNNNSNNDNNNANISMNQQPNQLNNNDNSNNGERKVDIDNNDDDESGQQLEGNINSNHEPILQISESYISKDLKENERIMYANAHILIWMKGSQSKKVRLLLGQNKNKVLETFGGDRGNDDGSATTAIRSFNRLISYSLPKDVTDQIKVALLSFDDRQVYWKSNTKSVFYFYRMNYDYELVKNYDTNRKKKHLDDAFVSLNWIFWTDIKQASKNKKKPYLSVKNKKCLIDSFLLDILNESSVIAYFDNCEQKKERPNVAPPPRPVPKFKDDVKQDHSIKNLKKGRNSYGSRTPPLRSIQIKKTASDFILERNDDYKVDYGQCNNNPIRSSNDNIYAPSAPMMSFKSMESLGPNVNSFNNFNGYNNENITKKYKWSWLSDADFKDYDPETSKVLEQQYLINNENTFEIKIRDKIFIINFKTWTQTDSNGKNPCLIQRIRTTNNDNISKPKPKPKPKKKVFQYLEEGQSLNVWINYLDKYQSVLLKAYNNNDKSHKIKLNNGTVFVIDFKKWEQRNKKTKKIRKIRLIDDTN